MWNSIRNRIRKSAAARFQRKILRALALHKRGELRTDGLKLHQASTHLEVTWSAREIHPWDRDESREERSARFVQQALQDTDAAIVRLFDALPQVDTLRVTVLDRGSTKIIMTGIVHRSAVVGTHPSVKMRLMSWGLRFTLRGSRFEALEESESVVEEFG